MTNVVALHQSWTPSTTYGDRIRRVRLDFEKRTGQKMTQERFAEIIGVGPRSLAAWEKDRNLPADPAEMAHQIARAIGCDPYFILGYDGEGHGGPGGQNTPVITDGASFACTRTPLASVTRLQRRAS